VRRAVLHLKRADPVMASIVTRVGPCRFRVADAGSHFQAVARSIIYQQLSGKAAGTIHARFLALFDAQGPSADALHALPDAAIQATGVSRQKLGYLRDLAARVQAGALPIETLHTLPDDEVAGHLTQVRGVGRWTAQMFLMFRLGRLDVLPELDLGIRKAIQRGYRLRALPDPRRVHRIGAPWAPYRTIASWYLWKSIDGDAS
jgi:DNA-3-methyladenine glycosylase II